MIQTNIPPPLSHPCHAGSVNTYYFRSKQSITKKLSYQYSMISYLNTWGRYAPSIHSFNQSLHLHTLLLMTALDICRYNSCLSLKFHWWCYNNFLLLMFKAWSSANCLANASFLVIRRHILLSENVFVRKSLKKSPEQRN